MTIRVASPLEREFERWLVFPTVDPRPPVRDCACVRNAVVLIVIAVVSLAGLSQPTAQPAPNDPGAPDPGEAEPTPTEPVPTEPVPTEPTEPVPTEPTEPTPTEPVPTEPVPTEPVPTEPMPTEPTPTEPTPTEPTVPTEAMPAPVEPIANPPVESDIVAFRIEKPRSNNNKILVVSLVGGAAVFGAVGLGFHLDSRSKSDEVSALGDPTGLVWTQEREDTRLGALRSRNISIGFYAVGSALAAAAALTYVFTAPGDEVVSMSKGGKVSPRFIATRRGAMIGAGWSFR